MASNINATLEDIIAAFNEMLEQSEKCCSAQGGKVEPTPSDKQPEYGNPGDKYQSSEEYFNARCNASNAIHDTVLELVIWLKDNNVGLKAGVFGGITSAIVLGLTLSGPGGWAIMAISGAVAAIAVWVVNEALDFEDVENALNAEHSDLIAALYTATSANNARAAYLAVLDAGSVPVSSEEMFLIKLMLPFSLLNQIFDPREDMATYESPSPIVCAGAPLLSWSFELGAESWTFRDDSTANASATVAHDASLESMKTHLIVNSGGSYRIARGVNVSPTLAQAVAPGNQIVIDHGAPSDGLIVHRILKMIYDDAREFEVSKINNKTAGSMTLAVTESGTLETIEFLVGRSNGAGTAGHDLYHDLFEVRVE